MSTDLDKACGRAYREKNRDRLRKSQRAYYEANKEKIVAYQKAYRKKGIFQEKKKQYYRAYMDKHGEDLLRRRREKYRLDRPLSPLL